jgi:hypothetical protein
MRPGGLGSAGISAKLGWPGARGNAEGGKKQVPPLAVAVAPDFGWNDKRSAVAGALGFSHNDKGFGAMKIPHIKYEITAERKWRTIRSEPEAVRLV